MKETVHDSLGRAGCLEGPASGWPSSLSETLCTIGGGEGCRYGFNTLVKEGSFAFARLYH